jgi:CubicO group peptidase (beta-lactamase class C family)
VTRAASRQRRTRVARIAACVVTGATLAIAQPARVHAQPVDGRTVGAPAPALDSTIAARMADAGIMGLGAAVLVDGEVIYLRGHGWADRARTRPFTPATLMNVGSIAKTVIGVAMMRAVQDGRVTLDEDVNRWLPFRVVNPHRPDARITLRHLATHTSGITDRWAVYERTYHYGGDAPDRLDRFLASYFTPGSATWARENFLDAAPGTMREYSNIGAALAAHVLERATGEPFDRWTRRHLFAPLGMPSTGWFLSQVDRARHTELFVAQEGFTIPIPHYGGTTWPDGGLRTSVAELTRFFRTILGDGALDGVRVVDAAQVAELRRFQFTDANRPTNYPAADGNSGLFWRTKFGGRRVGHGGNDPGIRTEMLADPAGRVAVVLLINTSTSGEAARAPAAILEALWRHGEARLAR